MRANEIPPPGFTPESDTTSAASPGRSSPPRRVFRGSEIGYPDINSAHARQCMIDDAQGRTHAPRACEKCRLSKRKCDKKLPHCDRCLRLNARCHYLPDPVSANANVGGAPIVVYQPSSLSNDLMLRHVDPLVAITTSQILSLISGPAFPAESEPDWRPSVRHFFTFIHPWYAVVHPVLFERRTMEMQSSMHDSPPLVTSQPSPVSSGHDDHPMSIKNAVSGYQTASEPHLKQLALLVVAMNLITRMRCTDSGCRPMFDAPYRTVKRLLALMMMGYNTESAQPSIELVQCGAIMALYEYGHGDTVTSYQTLSQTAAVAGVLGVRPGTTDPGSEKSVPGVDMRSLSALEREQRGGLWWGLFILDQFLHKDDMTYHLPFLLETPSDHTLLPETPPISDIGGDYQIETQPRHPVSTVVGTAKLGSFQLSAKISSLLHRALCIDRTRDPRSVKMPLTTTFADLDHEVRRSSQTLLEQTIQWETMLDCFAMLVSALFTLYLPYLPIIENTMPAVAAADPELTTALAALRFACKLSTDISCKINQNIDTTSSARSSVSGGSGIDDSLAILAAPAGATCYSVIVAFAGLSRIFPHEREECAEAIAEKFESLRLFSHRWGIAEEMMHQLRDRHGIKLSNYIKGQSPSPFSTSASHAAGSQTSSM